MFKINVSSRKDTPWQFEVEASKNSMLNHYRVFVDKEFYEKFNVDISPEKFVEKSFEFLLEREGPEEILKEFNLRQISDYFSDYETVLRKRLKIK